jgi:membrane-bound lytic murein transglycosylase D
MMESRIVFGALRLIVEVNVLLCCALVLARMMAARSSGSHRQRLRCAQVAFVLAFALPLALRLLPQRPILPAAAQVWSGGDIGRVSSETFVGTTWLSESRELSLDNGVLALLLVGVGAAAVGRSVWLAVRLLLLRRGLDALPSIRRIGRVSVVATSGEHVPFSAWLFGRAYVAIPETLVATDTSHYAIAVRHELAHHRQRDTLWIQAFEAASAFTFWNPATRAWSRLFTELMELACDEALVGGGRIDPRAYARCLADTATATLLAIKKRAFILASTEMGPVDDSFLRRRIEIMLTPNIKPHHTLFASLVGLFVLGGTALALQTSLQDRIVGAEQARALAARAQASDFSVVVNDQVLERINRLVGTPAGREFTQGALQRMPDYRAAIEQRLAENGMPASLVAVAFVESGFRNDAGLPTEPTLSPGLRGAGIWMFVPETARRYGLSVQPSRGLDERLNVAKETDAAIAYLGHLHRQFGDWHLALAAYNQGERQVARAIGETGLRDPFALAKQGRLNDYLATVMAGVVILANPDIAW